MAATTLAPRRRRLTLPRPVALLALALVLAAGSFVVTRTGQPAPAAAPARPAASQPAAPVALPDGGVDARPLAAVDAAIATWTANLERDGADFIAATHLAELYLVRGRLTSLPDDYGRAMTAVDQALATEPSLLSARLLRAQVLLASHDFAGAAAAADAILATRPGLPQALAALGDARLELGDYAGAERAYAQLGEALDAAPVTARRARLAAVTGSLDAARQLAADAQRAALADPAASGPDRAWYHLLVGSLAFQAGDLPAAETAYRAALELHDGSAPAFAGLGRTLAARGQADAAIAAYERAVAVVPQPDSLAALGDLLAAAGRDAEAATRYEQVRAMLAIGAADGSTRLTGRALVLYLANHGERTGLAVRMARAELTTRRDVYGWDALAWALLADGRVDAADAAMDRARAHGTEDALLDYHAGAIAAAAGRRDEAIGLLREALDRNPAFDPLGAERARALLAELEAEA